MSKSITLLGGTFDPVHNGHLRIARAAQAHCAADEVWFVPAGDPWQKTVKPLAAEVRLNMLELALADTAGWRIEKSEVGRTGPSYTIDTLERLRTQHPADTFTLIIGADQAQRLPSWHRWRELFAHVRIGIVSRDGYPDTLPTALQPYFDANRLIRVPMPTVAVSSTDIRQLVPLLAHELPSVAQTARQKLMRLLPPPVWRFIEENALYSGKLTNG
ncbi:MAG: nicotinate (nicotinamide) nucleotide adenylyltransferase [Burkholderiaceae bacterium]